MRQAQCCIKRPFMYRNWLLSVVAVNLHDVDLALQRGQMVDSSERGAAVQEKALAMEGRFADVGMEPRTVH